MLLFIGILSRRLAEKYPALRCNENKCTFGVFMSTSFGHYACTYSMAPASLPSIELENLTSLHLILYYVFFLHKLCAYCFDL